MQITVGTQDGQTFQIESENTDQIVGTKIGETFSGGIIGLDGYELEVTGGSDKDGFPMRKSVEGAERKRMLLEDGSGIQETEDGVKRRKSVRGNTVSNQIQQLNTKVTESGEKSVEELLEETEE
ncbi:MAG: small subunit ribosomal protein S6e [Colwellia polaris]|jgi:small subunit ribosomal protein S6e